MKPFNLNYKIQPLNRDFTHNILQIHVTISSISSSNVINLFKGKIQPATFTCSCPYEDTGNFYTLHPTHATLDINYTIPLGVPGKHGLQGACGASLTYFSGDQVFLFPTELLTGDNLTPSKTIGTVTIDYDFGAMLYHVIPFKQEDQATTSQCIAPAWHHSYELMKSGYVIGELYTLPLTSSALDFKVFTNVSTHLNTPHIISQLEALYLYYSQLFNIPTHDLSLVLLEGRNQEHLGGCGPHIICSSFDPTSLRDWQLLAHRMFHSFMDTVLPLNDFHVPSNLWLTEGLATYYENVALSALDDTFKKAIGLDLDLEFSRLFNRYLYGKLKPNSPFDFPPLAEKYIQSACKLEFLHYTHAPLVIKYLEDSYLQVPNQVLKTLLYTPLHAPFSLEQFFTNLLGPAVNYFSMNYLFEDHILPLWYLKDKNTFSTAMLLEDINYFDYLLYTWMRLEMPCSQESFSLSDIEMTRKAVAPMLPFPQSITSGLQSYSTDLYHLIQFLYIKSRPLSIFDR